MDLYLWEKDPNVLMFLRDPSGDLGGVSVWHTACATEAQTPAGVRAAALEKDICQAPPWLHCQVRLDSVCCPQFGAGDALCLPHCFAVCFLLAQQIQLCTR